MRQHAAVGIILLFYLVVGALYALNTPNWQAPDEPAHYNVVRQLANGRLPIIQPGDYDQALIGQVLSAKPPFPPEISLEPMSYEDWQPPLYYLLQTPVFMLSGGSLMALRLVSLLLGAGVVLLAYGLAWRLFAGQTWLALTTAVFVAFLPQHLAMMASVNNDALAELLIAAILFVLVGWVENEKPAAANEEQRTLLTLGLLLGLGYLTKGTVYPLTAVVGLTLLRRYWGRWGALLRAGLWLAAPAGLLGLLWWVRNVAVYGGLDVLGKAAHDAVVVGQPRTAEWVASMGRPAVVRAFIATTFNSFWGQFGWMAAPLDGRLYRLLWLFTAVWSVGLALALWRWWDKKRPSATAVLILFGTFLLSLAVHVVYNFTFVQHQGRYLFPALLPIGVGVSVGLAVWLRPFIRRWPPLRFALPLGLGLAMLALSLFALFRVVIPYL
ncbi:MAG: glycosyltransferase family 39 protein [Chloroflexi bacterium]|nr:glycosyltransferase family 39 protein [Chloroflexota bacterium]